MKKLIFVLLILTTIGFSLLADSLPNEFKERLEGKWKNQLGSTMVIESINMETGAIDGFYISPSGTTGQKFPLTGWINYLPPTDSGSNVIVVCFSVRWNNGVSNYGSVATWNGYLSLDGSAKRPPITGQWLLVRSNSNYIWDHIHTGQDIFKKK